MKRERKERSRLSSPHCHPLPFGSPTVRFRLGSLRSPTFTFTSGDRRERRWGGRCGPFPCHSRGPLRTVHRSSLRVVLSPPILVVRPSPSGRTPCGAKVERRKPRHAGRRFASFCSWFASSSLPTVVHRPLTSVATEGSPPAGVSARRASRRVGEVSRAFRFVTGNRHGGRSSGSSARCLLTSAPHLITFLTPTSTSRALPGPFRTRR